MLKKAQILPLALMVAAGPHAEPWLGEGAMGRQTPGMGLVQILGSSPTLPVFKLGFIVIMFFLVDFSSPTTPEVRSLLSLPPAGWEKPGVSAPEASGGELCLFGVR